MYQSCKFASTNLIVEEGVADVLRDFDRGLSIVRAFIVALGVDVAAERVSTILNQPESTGRELA